MFSGVACNYKQVLSKFSSVCVPNEVLHYPHVEHHTSPPNTPHDYRSPQSFTVLMFTEKFNIFMIFFGLFAIRSTQSITLNAHIDTNAGRERGFMFHV